MDDLRGLQLLRELHLRGTLANAAEALFLSPSAASHRLAVLEREVGVPLTERIGRRLRLTDTGAELAACAGRLQNEIEAADTVIEKARNAVGGRVRLGIFQTALFRILPHLLAALKVEFPAVRLEGRQMLAVSALKALSVGDLDLAIIPSYNYDPTEVPVGLHVEQLYTEDWFLMLPEGHPLSSRESPIELDELRDETWIAGETFDHFMPELCKSRGFEPNVAHRTSDYATMTILVNLGYGVTIMPFNGALGAVLPPVVVKHVGIPGAHHQVLALLRESSLGRPSVMSVIDVMRRPSARDHRLW